MIPAYMKAENIVTFTQEDQSDYRLRIFVDENTENTDGHVDVWMDTYEAVRLYQLLRSKIGPYVAEMEFQKAAFDRATPLERESVIHGHAACDPDEEWAERVRDHADLLRKSRRESQ